VSFSVTVRNICRYSQSSVTQTSGHFAICFVHIDANEGNRRPGSWNNLIDDKYFDIKTYRNISENKRV